MIDWKEAARHYRFMFGLARRLEIDLKVRLGQEQADNERLRAALHRQVGTNGHVLYCHFDPHATPPRLCSRRCQEILAALAFD